MSLTPIHRISSRIKRIAQHPLTLIIGPFLIAVAILLILRIYRGSYQKMPVLYTFF
jgi:hypothetical protein